ncbi:YgaP family membrane protein [Anditalea andensis]|uniref:DUF2892 domain-containing protein n=1 Tax=Anditalea andensis TaxID=1048983 RepID=A0A074L4W2_9BACT|nr:DUF2892 domain-containing protein [Anditalea andensis]KEO75520.1 hypothetical protein EL17_01340 [Anditalea andensis]
MHITEKITNDRVRSFTSSEINEAIDQQMEENVEFYSIQNPVTIKRRIEELDAEWDIERILELNASTLALTGILLSAIGSKKWLLLSGLVTAFMAQHAIQGWCPPLELLRKLKVRTRKEIDMEKHFLLKALEARPDLK